MSLFSIQFAKQTNKQTDKQKQNNNKQKGKKKRNYMGALAVRSAQFPFIDAWHLIEIYVYISVNDDFLFYSPRWFLLDL